MNAIKMKRNGVRAAALLLALALLLSMCGCSLLSSPKSVVLSFLNAVKQGDMEKVITCLKPSAQEKIKAVTGFSDNLFGVDTEEFLGSMLSSVYDNISEDCEFKVTDVRKRDSYSADVDVTILVNGERVHTSTISCVKVEGKWYIDP